VHVNDIREVWKFVNFISSQIPEANSPVEQLSNQFMQLKKEVETIKSKMRTKQPKGKTGNLFESE
jgi:outer membrane murein-binding lipoprotein Lpp